MPGKRGPVGAPFPREAEQLLVTFAFNGVPFRNGDEWQTENSNNDAETMRAMTKA